MNYDVLEGIIKNRRSIRKFKDEKVSKEVFEKIIECARWAPSSTNSQPWKFIGISDRTLINKIANVLEEEMINIRQCCKKSGDIEVLTKLQAFMKYSLFFKDAPGIILCLNKPYKSRFSYDIISKVYDSDKLEVICNNESIKSVSFAVQNILLSAHALGYGTCPMSAPIIFGEQKIKEILNITDEFSVMLLIALGRPVEEVKPTPRKEIDEMFEYIGP